VGPKVGRTKGLWLRPPVLYLGVGARRGADPATVREGVLAAFAEAKLSPRSVAAVVSVDEKRDEGALIALAEALGVPFRTYASEVLRDVVVQNPSERVRQAVGTASVAEASALHAAGEGARLLVPKVKGTTWTLSVAMEAGA
jgi:cobalamin biosynthesis protein CbiG